MALEEMALLMLSLRDALGMPELQRGLDLMISMMNSWESKLKTMETEPGQPLN
jgi:hypothetical protein